MLKVFPLLVVFLLISSLAQMSPQEAKATADAAERARQVEIRQAGAEAKAAAERQRQEAIKKAEELKQKLIKVCEKDLDSCSCSAIEDEEGQRECAHALSEARKKAQEQRKLIESQCRADPENCDCSSIPYSKERENCEREKQEALRLAQEERQRIMRECARDPDNCDCEIIENEAGKQECISKLSAAVEQKSRIENLCRENIQACDCSSIENEAGRQECEQQRLAALEQMESSIMNMINQCWDDVRNCPCEDIPDESIKLYCITQRNYGINCLDYGEDCDKIDEASFTSAPGVPDILKPFFQKSIQSYIKELRGQSLSNARQVIETCILDPKNCDCSGISKQAVPFCEKKKELGTRCMDGDYTACMELDATPRLPPGIPEFSRGPLESAVETFAGVQKGIILSAAAPVVSNTILGCVDDPVNCDCSVAPEGEFRTFCEYKKDTAISCVVDYDYGACFKIVNEPLLPEATPQIIKNFFETNALQKVDQRVHEHYETIRPDECKDLTMDECFTQLGYE